MAIAETTPTMTQSGTPTDRVLNLSLIVAPLLYLVTDTIYATAGWDSATAGSLHVLGAIAYGLVVLRIAAWAPSNSALAAALVLGAVAVAVNLLFVIAFGLIAWETSSRAR